MAPAAPRHAAEVLARVCDAAEQNRLPRAAFVMAHPDDETVGASFLLSRATDPLMVYVTDGAPRDGEDARASGFSTPEDYAGARKQELRAALSVAGHPEARIHFLDIPDQQASENLAPLASSLVELLRTEAPEIVVTHPYEGGHPDHDAAAFGVHTAQALLQREGHAVPAVVEMTSYHLKNDGFSSGEFLGNSNQPQFTVPVEGAVRELKQKLVACYPTQQRVLKNLLPTPERYRPAPAYDFSRPPHPGSLLYEFFPWKMTGVHWRQLASAALEELGLEQSKPGDALSENAQGRPTA